MIDDLVRALQPLVRIAELDDEARKRWGPNGEYVNTTDPARIELYTGCGGRCLLTLEDCLRARDLLTGPGSRNVFLLAVATEEKVMHPRDWRDRVTVRNAQLRPPVPTEELAALLDYADRRCP